MNDFCNNSFCCGSAGGVQCIVRHVKHVDVSQTALEGLCFKSSQSQFYYCQDWERASTCGVPCVRCCEKFLLAVMTTNGEALQPLA